MPNPKQPKVAKEDKFLENAKKYMEQHMTEEVTHVSPVKPLTEAQRKRIEAKQEAQAKKYWNTTATRYEVHQMLQQGTQQIFSDMRMLVVQNHVLLQLLIDKGISTKEEVEALTQVVATQLFSPANAQAPQEQEVAPEPNTEEVSADGSNNGSDSSN